MTEYEPGTCNINTLERKKRLVISFSGFMNSAVLLLPLFFFPEFLGLYVAIFLLNFAGFLGYFQYKQHFCANLALQKKFHVGEEEETVDDPQKVTKDRKKALTILFESGIFAAMLTLTFYLLLNF